LKTTIFIFLSILCPALGAQTSCMDNRLTQTAIFMDPTEIQMSGSINGILSKNITAEQYLPFSVGGDQSIFSKQVSENKAWEIVGEIGVFTQFEWKEVDGIQQRNLINIDYKVAFSFVKKIDHLHTYRLRFFHVSSHLGDDYILRNSIRSYTENMVNYEQLEFTYFRQLPQIRAQLITGIGAVIRPNATRLPFSYIFGVDNFLQQEDRKWSFTSGLVFKGFQETNFDLNVKAGGGIAYRSDAKKEPIRIVLEYYAGHLPYSQFEQEKMEWLGLGLYFNL